MQVGTFSFTEKEPNAKHLKNANLMNFVQKEGECIGDQVCVDGTCAQCGSNKDCDNDPGKPVCDLSTKRCVGCTRNADCPKGICYKNRCVACTKDSQCPKGQPKCLYASTPDISQCVACLTDKDCPGQKCIRNNCIEVSTQRPRSRVNLGSHLKSLQVPQGASFTKHHEYSSLDENRV